MWTPKRPRRPTPGYPDASLSGALFRCLDPVATPAAAGPTGPWPALGLAVGAGRLSPIATVVIGGILAATLLTLVVVPALLRLLERWAPTREDRFAAELEA